MCFEKWLNRYVLPMLLENPDFSNMLRLANILVAERKLKNLFLIRGGFCYNNLFCFNSCNVSSSLSAFLTVVIFGRSFLRAKDYVSHGVINKKKVMASIDGWEKRCAYLKFFLPKYRVDYCDLLFFCGNIERCFVENNTFEIRFYKITQKIEYDNVMSNSKIIRELIPYCKNFVFRTEASPEEFETMLKILCIL